MRRPSFESKSVIGPRVTAATHGYFSFGRSRAPSDRTSRQHGSRITLADALLPRSKSGYRLPGSIATQNDGR
jgi:hypothetical protein